MIKRIWVFVGQNKAWSTSNKRKAPGSKSLNGPYNFQNFHQKSFIRPKPLMPITLKVTCGSITSSMNIKVKMMVSNK